MKPLLSDCLRTTDIENFCILYSLNPKKIIPLKKQSRCVYEINCQPDRYIVKLFNSDNRNIDELNGEVELVKEFIKNDISTFDPIQSSKGNYVEQIKLKNNHSIILSRDFSNCLISINSCSVAGILA